MEKFKRLIETLNTEKVLKFGASTVLIGWAIIHFFWDGPYRGLLWSQSHVKWFVSGVLGYSWENYLQNLAVDAGINTLTRVIGVFMFFAGAMFLTTRRLIETFKPLVYLGMFCLLFLFLIKYQSSHYQLAMFIEHGGQLGMPLVAFMFLTKRWTEIQSRNVLKILLMMTFLGHGMYAIGIYPVPGHFIDMVIEVLGVSQSAAVEILFLAGAIDFLLCLLIWIPNFERFALAYCVFWGFATAMARPLSFILLEVNDIQSLAYWLTQSLYRFPHGIIPLVLLQTALVERRKRFSIEASREQQLSFDTN